MIRNSLDASSRYAMIDVTAPHGVDFQYRVTDGDLSSYQSTFCICFLQFGCGWYDKATRSEATSLRDGITWTLVGQITIAMSNTVYIGLAVDSNDNTRLATAAFDNVSMQDYSLSDTQPPTLPGNVSATGGMIPGPRCVDGFER